MENYFSPWYRWNDRGEYSGIEYPGIYVIAISKGDILEEEFSFRKEIVYVGMSNAVKGLDGRLKQFDSTIKYLDKPSQHGGADRVRYKHQNYQALVKKLYVSLRHFRCFPANETAQDLRAMGRVRWRNYLSGPCDGSTSYYPSSPQHRFVHLDKVGRPNAYGSMRNSHAEIRFRHGIVTGDFGQILKSVTFDRNG